MQRDSDRQGEEDAWRAIIDNYGDRPTLDDEPEPVAEAPDHEPAPIVDVEPDERFVPPAPPALPAVPRDRRAAWAGLFGAPAVLLICVVFSIALPPLIAYLLVGAFVGGFLYLVVTMSNGPVDPWDDGARL